jgi:FkbH-like protein
MKGPPTSKETPAPDASAPSYTHEDVVRALFRVLLLRDPTDANFPNYLRHLSGRSIDSIIRELLGSEEFLIKHPQFLDQNLRKADFRVSDREYRCPTELEVTPLQLRRIAMVGQCLLHGWTGVIREMMPACECDFLLFNMVQALPPEPPAPAGDYDFQVVGVPLRSILPEPAYFRLPYAEPAAYERLFEESVERLKQFLAAAMRWNVDHCLLTFVPGFILPQQNPLGRLLPRYDLRNIVYFVEQLNAALDAELRRYNNAYLFDFDQVVVTYGRRYFQDDAVWLANHNANLSDFDYDLDSDRIEKPVRASVLYSVKVGLFERLAWIEMLAMYRTIRQLDMVKLVVLDVDDTLWRGVAVEQDLNNPADVVEGWPIGLVEALSYLKRRGVLLALISKNEESLVAPVWQQLYGNRFPLEEFAIRRINWRPKAENLEEILQETALLPSSVVYVDDNPAERAAVKAAFPEVRVLGPNPLVWRRILLWAAETQVPAITAESASRTEMVKSQVEREAQQKMLSREEFLASLNAQVCLREICGVDQADFPRALELLNKTNQFNTTGRRWTARECADAFAGGTRFFAFEVRDKFTGYGLVGVVVCTALRIEQFVMSCRVVGLEVELAVISALLGVLQPAGAGMLAAELKETELNLLARDLWRRSGFEPSPDGWIRSFEPALAPPAHVRISLELGKQAASTQSV